MTGFKQEKSSILLLKIYLRKHSATLSSRAASVCCVCQEFMLLKKNLSETTVEKCASVT